MRVRCMRQSCPIASLTPAVTLPSFQGLGKLVRLRAKLSGAAGAVKSLFTGQAQQEDPAVTKMNDLRVSE